MNTKLRRKFLFILLPCFLLTKQAYCKWHTSVSAIRWHPSAEDVLATQRANGYTLPGESSPDEITDFMVIAVRNLIFPGNDRMNDWIFVFWITENGDHLYRVFKCTVDPSDGFLKTPINEIVRRKGGTAVQVNGHYPRSHSVDDDCGRKALEQVGPMTVARYSAGTKRITYDSGNRETCDSLEIGIHGWVNEAIDRMSAGCTVLHQCDMDFIVELARSYQVKHGGKAISYTLMDTREIRRVKSNK